MKLLKLFSLFTFSLFLSASLFEVHASRGADLNQFQEIDMEGDLKDVSKGYNFSNDTVAPKKEAAVTDRQVIPPPKAKGRYPANTNFDPSQTPAYYVGPLIFLLAIPLAFWILVSKKLTKDENVDQGKFYSKTIQFKPYQTDYQKNDDNDEDDQFPKAS